MDAEQILDDETVWVLADGYRWGYPECCIFQFVNDWVMELKPGKMRTGGTTPSGGQFVRCWRCDQTG